MKIPLMKSAPSLSPRQRMALIAAALLLVGAAGGWVSTMFTTGAVAVENLSAFEVLHTHAMNRPLEELKRGLIGSYVATGTDSDGRPYPGAGIVDITLAPSGALELQWEWDIGKRVGIGLLVVGDVLAVASSTNGRTAILIMNINPDGSLSGRWSRRADRGYRGTETWRKKT